jgi:hypothetical protein
MTLPLRADLSDFPKVSDQYEHFSEFINQVNSKELHATTIDQLNRYIEQVNAATPAELKKVLTKVQPQVIKLVEKEVKMVPKFYYRNLWMVLGMSVFGLPIGMIFGMVLKNMAFLGMGLPIGLALGSILGTSLDKKAEAEGRQFDWAPKKF